MSDVTDLLKAVAGTNSEVVNLIGGAIGTLANFSDIAGGVQAIVGLIDLFLPQGPDPVLGKLKDIQTEIQQDFAALKAEERVQNILTRWNNLDPPVAQGQSVLDQLKDVVSKVPPVTEEYRLQLIQICLAAVEQFVVLPLGQDPRWLTSFSDEIYYGYGIYPEIDPSGRHTSDQWASVIAPIPNSDGTVFSDRYTLPYYMRLLSAFLLTAVALEPDYQARYTESLQRFTARLQEVYDTSRQGIVTIRTPTASEMQGVGSELSGQTVYRNPKWPIGRVDIYLFWTIAVPTDYYGHPFTPEARQLLDKQFLQQLDDEWFQEYGVVHTYSGYSNISHYPPIPTSPPTRDDIFLLQFYAKLNLAIRRNWKEAYAAIGLAAVWTTINDLRKLTGDPPLARSDPNTTWSLLEISQILGSAFRDPSAPVLPYISVADIISGLATAGGITASWAPWRYARWLCALPWLLRCRRRLTLHHLGKTRRLAASSSKPA